MTTNKIIDPITFEVLRNSFKTIVNEMNSIIVRTAFSPIITEALDLSAGLFDCEGKLVAHGDYDLPVFIGNLEFTCRAILDKFRLEQINEGDIFIMNDPYLGGTHLNDVRILAPVFDNGQLIALCAACGHWPDIGGMVPGSFAPDATEIYQEGIRIVPMKLYQQGVLNEGILDLILANVRISEERKGDLDAQIASVRRGVLRMRELVEKYSVDTILAAMDEIMNYSERMLRAEIEKLPDGEYEWEDFIDQESSTNLTPKKIHITLRIQKDHLIFDFSKTDSASMSASNSTFPTTASGVFVATICMFPHIPMNHGCFKPVTLIAPEGSIVNAQMPYAVSGMAATSYEKIMAIVFGVFSLVSPEKTMACPYNLINVSMGGYDSRPQVQNDFVAYTRAEGGHGGRYTKDGVTGVISLYGSSSKNSPLEVLERRYPMLHTRWEIWQNSEGPGKFRGGFGSIVSFKVQADNLRVTCLGDREKFPPFGLFGGGNGAAHGFYLNWNTPQEENLSLRVTGKPIERGSELTIFSGGGGGYGNQYERDPQLVYDDVIQGYISVTRALDQYLVVIDSKNNQVDIKETDELRKERKIV